MLLVMQIRTRFSISADGYVTTPDGWPALVADPAYEGGKSHGFPEFQQTLERSDRMNREFSEIVHERLAHAG